jgi:hypothetical protein
LKRIAPSFGEQDLGSGADVAHAPVQKRIPETPQCGSQRSDHPVAGIDRIERVQEPDHRFGVGLLHGKVDRHGHELPGIRRVRNRDRPASAAGDQDEAETYRENHACGRRSPEHRAETDRPCHAPFAATGFSMIHGFTKRHPSSTPVKAGPVDHLDLPATRCAVPRRIHCPCYAEPRRAWRNASE